MRPEASTRLGIIIKPGSEPIAGQVRLPDGSTLAFEGYVQLIAAVERVHEAASVGESASASGPARA